MIVYAFGGQGTQHKGMGAPLFARFPNLVRTASEILGESIEEISLAGDARLRRTEFAQPAVFVVNALVYRAALDDGGLAPDCLIGHSLGELNALHAAGVFDFETGIRIVKERGAIMGRAAMPGSMIAVLGERERIVRFIGSFDSEAFLAIDNGPGETVIAGTRKALERCAVAIRDQQLGEVVPLAVSGPFHSPLMEGARAEFAAYLAHFSFDEPQVEVVANATAAPYTRTTVAPWMTEQLVKPVRFADSVECLLARGPAVFKDVSPRPVVTSIISRIVRAYASQRSAGRAAPTGAMTNRAVVS